ncbi:methyltransferase domain-containing protein [Acinetobacter sp. P1(2023)]|uniref:class I SAM-dependent methyltransferase n=1 Tax=unclassified Acinetobacter TaxID=196816 RepID=UPI0021CDA7E7|nr:MULTISPECIES: class I SAM-dependent methyltransferase [unclassified Acinetobacter]MCU4528572.1 methyltransferase domain-containing protein [Acinetobacter sp. WU_MDCI_Abxe169]MDC0840656.1 methyltransferase domain-containing protein [Acinetobacter sp. P1(2023)]
MAKDFNSLKVVEGYDQHIRKLIPGYEVIHLQVDAILQSMLPPNAHILIVGCGTGYELEYLLKRHPDWKFTAVDPSLTMLQKAQKQVELLGKSSQVTFVHGETSALPLENCFDAALSILVAHFISDEIKPVFFKNIYDRLKEKAVLLTYDLMTCVNPQQLQALRYLCLAQGLTEEQCQKMLERMDQDFFSLTTEGYIKLLEKAGFERVQSYTQILTYQGFIAKK